jgi:hypothetical protein
MGRDSGHVSYCFSAVRCREVSQPMYIPYCHDRVIWKATAKMCLVVFVDVHNRSANLFTLRGAGELIRGVPFSELVPLDRSSPFKTA